MRTRVRACACACERIGPLIRKCAGHWASWTIAPTESPTLEFHRKKNENTPTPLTHYQHPCTIRPRLNRNNPHNDHPHAQLPTTSPTRRRKILLHRPPLQPRTHSKEIHQQRTLHRMLKEIRPRMASRQQRVPQEVSRRIQPNEASITMTTNHLPTSRTQADLLGERFYFTGKPCKHGHTAKRYASNGKCAECKDIYMQEWRRKNRERIKEYDREYNLTRR